ncbi:MAG: hypothetical protein S4CHLAM20_11340 [Chlamydiia bacterium]|nr:hypothetical protein [Chlamydiia bacterium]
MDYSLNHNISNTLPSGIFARERKEGDNVYRKAANISKMISESKGSLKGEAIIEAIKTVSLNPKEMVQVLTLVSADTSLEEKQVKLLKDVKNSISLTSKSVNKKVGKSPREISLEEGELPKIDEGFKKALIGYLKGVSSARELNINKNNYKEALVQIKIFDLEMDRVPHSRNTLGFQLSTYELRTRCLVASEGKMPSFEAYTKSINNKYFKNPFSMASREYASHEENYVTERVALHSQVVMKYSSDMIGLSNRFNNKEPTIYALSGNTAVGKSYMAKSDAEFVKGIDEDGEATGALNPDSVKALLRKEVDGVTNQQIHIEGFALNNKLKKEIYNKALQTSMVIDERLGTVTEINNIIEVAKKSGKKLVIKDIDAPLAVSTLRVLGRDVKTDPCVPFGPIAGGYKAIRRDRAEVMKTIIDSSQVKSYELYVTNESGKSGLAAKKKIDRDGNGSLEVVDMQLLDYALSGEKKADEDIQALKDSKVSKEIFEEYNGLVKNTPLTSYNGRSIDDALMAHSLVLPVWED